MPKVPFQKIQDRGNPTNSTALVYWRPRPETPAIGRCAGERASKDTVRNPLGQRSKATRFWPGVVTNQSGINMQIVTLDKRWELGIQVGEGAFGSVFEVTGEDGKPAVVKLIPKGPGADRELLFVNLTGVPNVIPVLDRGEWENYYALVMPRAEKSLSDR